MLTTAIFVIKGRRTAPWRRPSARTAGWAVDSTLYTTASMLRTKEQIVGRAPLQQLRHRKGACGDCVAEQVKPCRTVDVRTWWAAWSDLG